MTDQPAVTACEHHYETRILGGHPLSVRVCILCRVPDWDDLSEQVATIRDAARQAAAQPAAERTLTPLEHDRAWHAIEGAAGEPDADPGTVLAAVLRALRIHAPSVEDEQAASRRRQQATATPSCSIPPCNVETDIFCERHQREHAHAEGEHCFCGAECAAAGLAAPTNHTTEAEEDARHELYDYATITFHETGIPESVHAYVTCLIATYRTAILTAAADKAEAIAIRLHNAGETTASNGANEAMSALRRLAAGAES